MQWRRLPLLAPWFLIVTAVAQHPSVDVVPAEPLPFIESGDSRVWIRPGAVGPKGGVAVLVRFADSFSALEPATFECEIHCEENASDSLVTMEITGEDGDLFAVGEQELNLVKGINRCDFAWDPAILRDGTYKAHIYVYHPLRGEPPFRDLQLIKISEVNLQRELAQARDAITALKEYVPAPDQRSVLGARYALATEYMPVAEWHAAQGDWPAAQHVARYVARTAFSIRAYLTFANNVAELIAPVPTVDMAALRIENGSFYSGSQPVFLFGWNQGVETPANMSRARELGLNAAVVSIPPATARDTATLRPALDRIFDRARENNIAVTAIAPIAQAFPWTPENLPDTMEELRPVEFIAAERPAAREAIESYLHSLLPALSNRPNLLSLSIADKPAFRMDGPDVLAAFAHYVQQLYPDRLAINRAWQTRFSEFSEIDAWWTNDRPAYQYDWQSFQRQAGTRFFEGLTQLVRGTLPHTPLQVQFAGNIFQRGQTHLGIDHEAIAALTQISGCSVPTGLLDADYALNYPSTAITYAFLRSIAPGQPIYNTEQRLWSDLDPFTQYSFGQIHSTMWDGAIEGQDGSAIAGNLTFSGSELQRELYHHPESFEGYLIACLNINRLAPIVQAFQNAPDDVAILYSVPSLILNGGSPYVDSLVAAFEGASLAGRKVGFVTEDQVRDGALHNVRILIIPNMTAISQPAFEAVNDYIRNHGLVVRAGTTLPYDAWGHSRTDIVSRSLETVYLQESAGPTQFYHAMDAVDARPGVTQIPHAINNFYYPIEGIKTRFLILDGVPYLFLLSVRQDEQIVYLTGPYDSGRDLIGARDVRFPMNVAPLNPMLIRLNIPDDFAPPTVAAAPETIPTIPVTPITPDSNTP